MLAVVVKSGWAVELWVKGSRTSTLKMFHAQSNFEKAKAKAEAYALSIDQSWYDENETWDDERLIGSTDWEVRVSRRTGKYARD